MKKKLLLAGGLKMLSGLLVMGLLLFVPAGTWRYPGGWRLMALLFVPMPVVGVVLYVKAPELLEKRLNSREQEPEQKRVILLSALVFVAGFVLAGVDFRFGWTRLPMAVVVAGCVLFCGAYGLYAEVMRENAWLSRTVEVQEGQQVVDTGLYGVVRHPHVPGGAGAVPLHAPGAGLRRGGGALPDDPLGAGAAHPQRGAGAGDRASGIWRLQKKGEVPADPLPVVSPLDSYTVAGIRMGTARKVEKRPRRSCIMDGKNKEREGCLCYSRIPSSFAA